MTVWKRNSLCPQEFKQSLGNTQIMIIISLKCLFPLGIPNGCSRSNNQCTKNTEDRDMLTSMKMQSTKSHCGKLYYSLSSIRKNWGGGGGKEIQEELAMKKNCKDTLTNNNVCTLFGSWFKQTQTNRNLKSHWMFYDTKNLFLVDNGISPFKKSLLWDTYHNIYG